eukprot:427292-Prymnesium_polylepis.2
MPNTPPVSERRECHRAAVMVPGTEADALEQVHAIGERGRVWRRFVRRSPFARRADGAPRAARPRTRGAAAPSRGRAARPTRTLRDPNEQWALVKVVTGNGNGARTHRHRLTFAVYLEDGQGSARVAKSLPASGVHRCLVARTRVIV